MSLYGMMRTSVSGMAAQSTRLGTVADNIANSSTTGYKRSDVQFSSLIIPSTKGGYSPGGVTSTVRQAVSEQGVLQYTTSASDLAIKGDGFFVVQDDTGNIFLTRAGNFVPNDEGYLVNAAGFKLMAYSYENGTPTITANGFEGLEPIRISETTLTAMPSANGYISSTLPVDATAVAAADLPSTNSATAQYTAKTSLVSYDNVGREVLLDVYYTKTGANTWEVAVYDRAGASAGTGFPYASGPLSTETLTFDPANGQLAGGSATNISVPVPNGAALTIDLSQTSELGTNFTLIGADTDGNAPSAVEVVEIAADGNVYAQYSDGSFTALYRIPLATVISPDNLRALPGNVYGQSSNSGTVQMSFAGEGGTGSIVSGALESSNVDIAEELTSMIEAQRSYTANSKVFQTGSELMDILVNLKR
jgi:flagellar hook protein FlgE